MPKKIDLTGQKYGRLTAISSVGIRQESSKKIIIYWNCQCDCGNIVLVSIGNLRSGKQKSCGCLNIEKIIERNTKHGKRYSRTYNIWAGIKQRCRNKKCKEYQYYGGRGITVCDEWFNSFEAFLNDMGECPNEKFSIDRKNNEKGYYKENCQWATKIEQANNNRNNRIIEFNGKLLTLSQWSKETGITKSAIEYRLNNGWSIEDTLTTPTRKFSKKQC